MRDGQCGAGEDWLACRLVVDFEGRQSSGKRHD